MTEYIAAISDSLGITIRRFKTKSEAEAYAEVVEGWYFEYEDGSNNILKEIEAKIETAVEKYQTKKSKHIEGL